MIEANKEMTLDGSKENMIELNKDILFDKRYNLDWFCCVVESSQTRKLPVGEAIKGEEFFMEFIQNFRTLQNM